MATVWAPYDEAGTGRWHDKAYVTGWSDTVLFSSLSALAEKMKARGLQGKVTRLGIVAHGDEPGVVHLDRRLTVRSLGSFAEELEQLRWHLTSDAMVVFYSCIAGKAIEGERFLNALSQRLAGRTIVGFTTYGETSARGGVTQTPGTVVMNTSSLSAADRKGPHALLTPWHVAAKWALDGRIVRSPPLERQAGNRCANPQCPGHGNQLHHCAGWG